MTRGLSVACKYSHVCFRNNVATISRFAVLPKLMISSAISAILERSTTAGKVMTDQLELDNEHAEFGPGFRCRQVTDSHNRASIILPAVTVMKPVSPRYFSNFDVHVNAFHVRSHDWDDFN